MDNNKPKIIDLFSGVGGLSLGAVKADFDLIAAVEKENRILNSHSLNFPNSKHLCEDVLDLKGSYLRKISYLNQGELAGLIGGPPCQGFSTIGKRNINDSRNYLFLKFFELVKELQPVFFMAENVPGILNEQYSEIRKTACKLVEGDYDLIQPLKVKASDFGAATIRTRIFFIGIRKDVKGSASIIESIEKEKRSSKIFVGQAIEGLPVQISEDWKTYDSSWQVVDINPKSEYLSNLNRIVEKIGNKEAISKFHKDKKVSGCFVTKHSPEVAKRYSNLLPGQMDSISKSIKLDFYGFCPTLRAGTDSSKGSFQAVRPIHPTQARVITPREAARLQGFPDWFQFHETKWHSFRQIGNSVCPIAAEKVLKAIKEALNM